jgi:hypothetical protein
MTNKRWSEKYFFNLLIQYVSLLFSIKQLSIVSARSVRISQEWTGLHEKQKVNTLDVTTYKSVIKYSECLLYTL